MLSLLLVIRILCIGNSFSWDAVEQELVPLCAEKGIEIEVNNLYYGGCSLEQHAQFLLRDTAAYSHRVCTNHKNVAGERESYIPHLQSRVIRDTISLREALRDGEYDVISLQQASHYSGLPKTYANLGQLKRLVQSYTTNLHVEFVWHMTWAYADDFVSKNFEPYDNSQHKMYTAIVSTMQNVLPAIGQPRVIPSGTAIQLGRYRLGDTLNRDGYHLSLTLGRYIAACTWCEFLTGRIVDGNSYWPETITEEEAQTCQLVAHEAMFMQQQGRYLSF